MERVTVDNRYGPPLTLVVAEVPAAELTEAFALIRGIEPELIACHTICFDAGGYRFAEAITYGAPDGVGFRLVLTGPGMHRRRWERLVPAEASAGEMVRAYWADPSVTAR